VTRILHHATLNAVMAEDGVERPAPGKAPTAFRIWRAGENKADDGSVFFTPDSAEKLMTEQASKGRPLSIDYDHLSLAEDRPAEAGKAAGWHAIEARDTDSGPELWAVNVDWCTAAKEGLEAKPPTWRFFSPAFYTDEERQVTSYINLALCINPMTHGIPSLASNKITKETTLMTAEEMHAAMLAKLDALIAATDDPTQKAGLQAARDAMADMGSSDEAKPSDSALPVAASATAEGATAHADAMPADDKKKDDDATKSAAVAHAAKAPDAVAALTATVMRLERRAEVNEIDGLLAKHAGLPDAFKAHCRKLSLEQARVNIEAVAGVVTHARKEKPSQGSTEGSDVIDPREGDWMDRQMGLKKNSVTAPHKLPDGRFVMHNVRPSDMARMNAQKGKA
jgi:phage I-like protein